MQHWLALPTLLLMASLGCVALSHAASHEPLPLSQSISPYPPVMPAPLPCRLHLAFLRHPFQLAMPHLTRQRLIKRIKRLSTSCALHVARCALLVAPPLLDKQFRNSNKAATHNNNNSNNSNKNNNEAKSKRGSRGKSPKK